MVIWSDPNVQSALITTAGTVFATVVAGLGAALIGKRISDNEKLKEIIRTAIDDIHFLLVVEEEHCAIHKENSNQSNKMRIRQITFERGYEWSGKFTPGRAKGFTQKN